jgi:hypothetical protein
VINRAFSGNRTLEQVPEIDILSFIRFRKTIHPSSQSYDNWNVITTKLINGCLIICSSLTLKQTLDPISLHRLDFTMTCNGNLSTQSLPLSPFLCMPQAAPTSSQRLRSLSPHHLSLDDHQEPSPPSLVPTRMTSRATGGRHGAVRYNRRPSLLDEQHQQEPSPPSYSPTGGARRRNAILIASSSSIDDDESGNNNGQQQS